MDLKNIPVHILKEAKRHIDRISKAEKREIDTIERMSIIEKLMEYEKRRLAFRKKYYSSKDVIIEKPSKDVGVYDADKGYEPETGKDFEDMLIQEHESQLESVGWSNK